MSKKVFKSTTLFIILLIIIFPRATAKAICNNFQAQDIIDEFETKQQQKPAIVCAIKEIF